MNQLLSLPSQFGPMIRATRKNAGLTQAHVAQRMGLSQKRISAIEQDPSSLSFDQMLRLCSVLGLEILVQSKNKPMQGSSRKAEW